MKHTFLSSILLCAFALLTSCGTAETTQQLKPCTDISESFYPERLERLDKAFQEIVDKELMPQLVTFVAHKGEIIHYKAFGWRDRENKIPCQKDDIFRMASQTKAIAVVGLMTLFEEGKFLLDEPIKKYIPEFANPRILDKYDPKTGTYTTRAASKDITIRHLMTHTSGISYNGPHWDIAAAAGVPPLNSLEDITLKEMVEKLAKLPLAHEPGEKFTYSMNIEVLGRLAEILSGQPIDVFLKERILDPLGMNDTHFYLPENKVDRLVKLYEYPKGGKLQLSTHPIYQSYPYAGAKKLCSTGAGLSGTILDYAKFCQMILNEGEYNGRRIIGRKTLELMQQNAVGDIRGDIGFGLAWDVFRPQNAHNSIVSVGSMRWGGMFGTDYIIDPKEDLIVMVYVNIMPNNSGVNQKTLMHNLVYQAIK